MKGIFSEIYRATFPKKLRFDQASQVLYGQCYSLSRQYKNKKYLPLEDVQGILNQYTYVPVRPWLRLPFIRHILFIRMWNTLRYYFGGRESPSWLWNRGVEEEYEKLKEWCKKKEQAASVLHRQKKHSQQSFPCWQSSFSSSAKVKNGAMGDSNSQTSSSSTSTSSALVVRDEFEREILQQFHVATVYQRVARFLIFLCVGLLMLAVGSLCVDTLLYGYFRYWKEWDRKTTKEWFRQILLRHTVAEVPPAYASLLPYPCVARTNPVTGSTELAVSVVELELADPLNHSRGGKKGVGSRSGVSSPITVLAIPTPHMGEKSFFQRLGRIIRSCDAVVLEGVSFDKLDKMIPATLLPLKEDTFPALGLHHRFLDILQSDQEPPMLYPGGSRMGWRTFFKQVVTPFEVQCVYAPTMLAASKGEAKVGWGRLQALIDRRCHELEQGVGKGSDPHVSNGTGMREHTTHRAGDTFFRHPSPSEPYVICLPWTIQHIVNIEASLIKYGFKVKRVFLLPWIDEDYMGNHFCDYYQIF